MTTPKKHILSVDDSTDTCELVTHILKDYKVTSAYSMADAVKGGASFMDNLPAKVSQLLKA